MKKLLVGKINLADLVESPQNEGEAFENMTRLIKEKLKKMKEFEEATAKRDEIFLQLHEIARVKIPELANAIGQTYYQLSDGTQVEITIKLEASPSKKRENEVYKWLETMGAGSIIKKQITMEFDRTDQGQSDFEYAERVLRDKGVVYAVKQAVNKATLEKHIRECREKGIKVDEKLLGVFDIYDTVINGVKTPKK
jgi:hypothetical protein